MIFLLKGKVVYQEKDFLVLQVGDIGYQIFVGLKWLKEIKINENLKIFTYLYVREETQELYGFSSPEELDFFKKLLAISGVGPKLAQGILSVVGLFDLKKIIREGQVGLLTKVPGVGQKIAQRIVIDLRGKIEEILKPKIKLSPIVVTALSRLGYRLLEIKKVMTEIPPEIQEPKEQLKAALKVLNRLK